MAPDDESAWALPTFLILSEVSDSELFGLVSLLNHLACYVIQFRQASK
jgi:hypothetical protein